MDRFTSDERACLLLTAVDALGIKKRHTLLSLFSEPRDIFVEYEHKKEEIISLCKEDYYQKLCKAIEFDVVDKLICNCDKKGIVPITYYSDDYPSNLMNIYAPPLVLFCKGNTKLLNSSIAIGVVGSRKCSRYGLDVANCFGKDLAENGVTVVSGMARGIDGSAHRGALSADGNTIAVLASGVDVVYPADHKDLYRDILEKGLVISEYLPGESPLSYRFPERNRIISGISNGLLVVEAGEKSGALITLDEAVEQGREIFIVPSNINSYTAKGSNERLRAMPSALTLDANDILLRFGKRKQEKVVDSLQLDFMEENIISLLQTGERHFDELLELTELPPSELGSLLSRMEVCGLIKDLGGNYYGL